MYLIKSPNRFYEFFKTFDLRDLQQSLTMNFTLIIIKNFLFT